MPPVHMKGDGRKAKNPKKTLARLLSYLKPYRTTMIIVVICLLLSSLATALSSYSLEPLIDDYIKPLKGQANPDFGPLVTFLIGMAVIYIVGILSAFLSSFLMAKVGQGMQKQIRDEMFTHMQRLPIRYFDAHPTGDVMSRYTSDIDTLRPQLCASRGNRYGELTVIDVIYHKMSSLGGIFLLLYRFFKCLDIVKITKNKQYILCK